MQTLEYALSEPNEVFNQFSTDSKNVKVESYENCGWNQEKYLVTDLDNGEEYILYKIL